MMMMMLTKFLSMTMVVEAETRAPPTWHARCRVSPTLTSGMSTPPFCSVVGTKAFRPQRRLRNLLRRAKSTHKAHTSIFYPGSGRPLANNPTSCFGGFSGVDSVQDDEHSGAGRMLSIASTPPRLPLPLVFSSSLALSFLSAELVSAELMWKTVRIRLTRMN